MVDRPTGWHRSEPHDRDHAGRTNWLRAGVLGANDGIVSVAGLVVGVAGATGNRTALLTAGLAGVVAGALSMAVGEYVSVSTQRDTERALLAKERRELAEEPEAEFDELVAIYEGKGLSSDLALQVAAELTANDPFLAHAEAELGIDPEALVNPWAAALSSLVAFTLGAVLPLLAIVLPPASLRVPITVVAVVVALVITGSISSRLGGAKRGPAIVRVVGGGLLAMLITYAVGSLIGAAI